MKKENSRLESIIVQDFQENPIDLLKKYAGKPLLIIIYHNQCLGCTGRAIPMAYEFQKEYKNFQILGIHTNHNNTKITESDIKSIFTIDRIPFPIYLDNGQKVYDQFQSEGTPQWVLIKKDGTLFRSIFGSQEGAQNRLMYSLEEMCQ